MRHWVSTAVGLWLGCATLAVAQQPVSGGPPKLVVSIHAGQTAEPVSPYEYGMFIEHIGSLVYRSLWSEMLDDRKFYSPISSKADAGEAGEKARPGSSHDVPLFGGTDESE